MVHNLASYISNLKQAEKSFLQLATGFEEFYKSPEVLGELDNLIHAGFPSVIFPSVSLSLCASSSCSPCLFYQPAVLTLSLSCTSLIVSTRYLYDRNYHYIDDRNCFVVMPSSSSSSSSKSTMDVNTKNFDFFDKQIVEPLESLLGAMEEVKKKIKDLDDKHMQFDHYEKKVADLTRSRDARIAKGKQESSKDVEKMRRNETKFYSARDNFNVSSFCFCLCF